MTTSAYHRRTSARPRPLAPARGTRPAPSGFTMVELLLVLVIILILISLVLFGVFRAGEGMRGRNTEATLQNLTTMLAAYRQADVTAGRARGAREPVTYFGAIEAPGLVSIDQQEMDPALHNALLLTQAVMGQLLRVDANQSAMAELSIDAFMAVPSDPGDLSVNQQTGRLDPPIFLDGWGNPIIYVPPGGLAGLLYRGETDPRDLRSPDGRGFFASAGPDGIFGSADAEGTLQAGADDNIYSFPR